jgi:hypothetical protein
MAAATGCGGSVTPAAAASTPTQAPVSLSETKPYFFAGESITWKVSFAGIEGARARLAVGQVGKVDGRRVVVLRAEFESAGLVSVVKQIKDNVSSYLDLDANIPARTESESNLGAKYNIVHTVRTQGNPVAQLKIWQLRDGESATTPEGLDGGKARALRMPRLDTQDPLSALMFIRGWNAPTRARATVYTLGGERFWRTTLTMEKKEEYDGPLGKRKAVKISGESQRMMASLEDDKSKAPRHFTVWVSDDAQRIPLAIKAQTELGQINVEATSYEAP